MVNPALVEARLTALGLAAPTSDTPAQVLDRFGPMQGQELPGVTSSIALRLAGSDATAATAVEDAFTTGSVVRGYPMRATVFALAARDAAWVTELCAGPQRRQSRRRLEQDGLSSTDIGTAHDLLREHPDGLSRPDLAILWSSHGLPETRTFLYLLVRDMMLHGTAVYGPPDDSGGQLIVPAESWLPAGSDLAGRFNGDTTAATADLLLRYLHGHGPAGLRDFAWWTKLPVTLIRDAFGLIRDEVEPAASFSPALGEDAWVRPGLADEITVAAKAAHGTFLLPAFDELVLGYRDRLVFLTGDHHDEVAPGNNGAFRKTVVRGGKFVATWRAPKTAPTSGAGRRLTVSPFRPLSTAAERDITRTFRSYPHA
ncbi:winged helix DNA-binding domain-containing protein [uncultured Corynebacterium sp.]|uniref:winged helix DNA-binding domain-containing protein n=1 Tax=uncultured Corynebacterium sp. TaxID=159447 RepID=UPI0025EA1C8E|nr:winged helix DNA-binding domain-containing protein [uncultured Corynebacterium sp.]